MSPRTDADELFDHEVNYQLYYYMSSTLLCGRLFIVRIFAKSMEFRYYLPLSFTLSLFDRYQLHSCGFLVIDSIGLDGLVSYNHLFIFVLGFSLTFLGAFNHCQRRIQLQCKFFMIYFMKILPTMYSSLFDCWFFAL